jgi:hypothetical protein
MINVVKVESWRVEREEKKDGRSGGSSGGGKKELFWMGFFSLSAFLLAVTAGDSAYYGKITLAA